MNGRRYKTNTGDHSPKLNGSPAFDIKHEIGQRQNSESRINNGSRGKLGYNPEYSPDTIANIAAHIEENQKYKSTRNHKNMGSGNKRSVIQNINGSQFNSGDSFGMNGTNMAIQKPFSDKEYQRRNNHQVSGLNNIYGGPRDAGKIQVP